jgi:hypothetical protein
MVFGNESKAARNLLTFLNTDRKVNNEKWITTSILLINRLIADLLDGPGNLMVSVLCSYELFLRLVSMVGLFLLLSIGA